MPRRICLLVCCGCVWLGTLAIISAADPAPRYADRWFYASNNLLVPENVEHLIALIERAGKSGYNGVVLADYKFNILDRMPDRYFTHVQRVRAAAAKAQIEIIPSLFPIGYSDGLLAHDPNLAEGLPVTDAPFVVKDRVAVLAPDANLGVVKNGDLEEVAGHTFSRFAFQDDPGKTTFADRDVVHHGAVSCRMQDIGSHSENGNCRLSQRVQVRPHAVYRLSCWVKTDQLRPTGAFRLLALATGAGNRQLTFYEAELEATQDWERKDVVFNTLAADEIQIYAGQWGGRSGTLWLDELQLEELPLVNVLRRDGCPLVLKSADGKTVYEEGRDFEPVVDPQLGQVPYAGEFKFDHPGATLRLTPKSRIKEGDRLLVSWYHPVLTHGFQVMCCLSEPKVYELLRDQARRVNKLFEPRTVFMSHDEIRVANWCHACQSRKQTPGQLLADNAARCVKILKEINPEVRVVVWSDMFDPHHNAVDNYYLVNGTLAGSWEGLSKDVIIANWNSGKGAQSLKWFSDRGHPQVMAGYYDTDDLSGFLGWDKAAQGIPQVRGFMYTTWQRKYKLLEEYGKAMR